MEWSGIPEQSSTPATAESVSACSIPHVNHALETTDENPMVFTNTRFSTLPIRVQILRLDKSRRIGRTRVIPRFGPARNSSRFRAADLRSERRSTRWVRGDLGALGAGGAQHGRVSVGCKCVRVRTTCGCAPRACVQGATACRPCTVRVAGPSEFQSPALK